MDNEPPILRCFQHCDKLTNIICYDVPVICPLCGHNTTETEFHIPPYLLPSPFTTASSCPYSFVIRPTDGDFICDYTQACNLHIGITDSTGVVYDFDEEGLHIGSVRWQQCLSIDIATQLDLDKDDWISRLRQFAVPNYWTVSRYKESTMNCFDFALKFLQTFPRLKNLSSFRDKRTFCEEFVVKKTKKAAQYISLYRQVGVNGYVCQQAQVS